MQWSFSIFNTLIKKPYSAGQLFGQITSTRSHSASQLIKACRGSRANLGTKYEHFQSTETVLEFHFQKPPITCGVTSPRRYLGSEFIFNPPYVPPHPLAASGDGVSLASSLTKDKWALGLWWSTMAARGFQNSKLFFIWSKVIWSTMRQALTFTIS